MNLKKIILFQLFLYSVVTYGQDKQKKVSLEPITIEANRTQGLLENSLQKVQIIDSTQLRAIPNSNLGDVIKRYVNVDIIEYPGALTAVGMRGFPPSTTRSYTLLLIDGKPSGTNNLATVPIDFIDHIEIIKGPYSILYGADAIGGAINIITKHPDEIASGRIDLSTGSFGQTFLSGYASGKVAPNFLLSFGYSHTEQSQDYRIGGSNLLKLSETEKRILDKWSYGDVMNGTKYQINQFNSTMNYKIDSKWSAELFTILNASNDLSIPGNYWHTYGMSKKGVNRLGNYLDVHYRENKNDATFTFFHNKETTDNYTNNTDSAFIGSKNILEQYGVRIGNNRVGNYLKWQLGLDYEMYSEVTNPFSVSTKGVEPYHKDNSRNLFSAFFLFAYTWKKLTVNTGIRYNDINYIAHKDETNNVDKQTMHYTSLNPSVGFKYKVMPELTFHVSGGNSFYSPDTYKRVGVFMDGNQLYVGNKDLRPQTLNLYEVGASYGQDDRFNVDVTYFQGFFNQKIVTDNILGDTLTYKNAESGMMNGLELMVSSNIARFWHAPYQLSLQCSLTNFFNNYYKEPPIATPDELMKRSTLYVRRVMANFGVFFSTPEGFDARLDGRFIGHRLENDWLSNDKVRPDITASDYYTGGGYTSADRILRHPKHFIFDFSIHYIVKKRARIGLSIANMLDENYTEKDGLNMPGRNLLGQFSYQF